MQPRPSPDLALAALQAHQAQAMNAALRATMAKDFMVALLPTVADEEDLDVPDPVETLDKAADLAVTAADRLLLRLSRAPNTYPPR